ncbi:MAG: fructosamine kinase family protein [Bacteroidetes bacterium]|nr:fructosamine kinase family protein [Bacteroidota bacterium]
MIPKEITDSLSGFFATSGILSFTIHSASSLSGGCINNVSRLSTSEGEFCIKYNKRDLFPEMFEGEADGLEKLKSAGVIRVPGVVCPGYGGTYSYLLLEFINPGRKTASFYSDFGRSLARLHRHTADHFGLDRDNYMGSLKQFNIKHSDWISFFVEERLERQISLAHGYLSPSDLSAFKRLYNRLGEIMPEEPPALLHGDLWGGNYMVSPEGKACLIDPAVYYGHREIDIAMTTLFGGFDGDFYASYNEEYPLEKGWKERLDVFNLYPLLIHLNLFGSGYLGSVERIIRKF